MEHADGHGQAAPADGHRIGFIGTGNLGAQVVGRLLAAGHPVTVHDRDPAAAEAVIAAGARWAGSPAELAGGVETVMTCLPRPDIVAEVVGGAEGILTTLRPGSCWIDITTNDVEVLRRMSELAATRHVDTLEAPVTGGVHKAAAGELTVLVGGDPATYAAHRSLLEHVGSRVIYLGPLGQASKMKVITNMLAFIHLVAAGEGLMLAAGAGIDLKDAFEAIRASSGNSFVHETESQLILSGSYDIGFTIDLACKDLGLAEGLASSVGVPTELAEVVRRQFERARQRYGGSAWSPRVVQLLEDETGLSLRAEGFPTSLIDSTSSVAP